MTEIWVRNAPVQPNVAAIRALGLPDKASSLSGR